MTKCAIGMSSISIAHFGVESSSFRIALRAVEQTWLPLIPCMIEESAVRVTQSVLETISIPFAQP